MPRNRKSVSDAYARRNARARELGYRNYYDYRTHNHGKLAPSAPRPTGEARQRLRGHRGQADLRSFVKPNSLVTIGDHSPRRPDGSYQWVDITVTRSNGDERTFRLRGKQLDEAELRKTIGGVVDSGGVLSPSPSLDLRQMATPELYGADDPEVLERLEAEAELELAEQSEGGEYQPVDDDSDIPF